MVAPMRSSQIASDRHGRPCSTFAEKALREGNVQRFHCERAGKPAQWPTHNKQPMRSRDEFEIPTCIARDTVITNRSS